MVTDLEKQFFDTFGIEPYDRYYNCIDNLEGECKLEHSCCVCDKSEDIYCYPEITDRILLELICIVAEYYCFRCDNWVEQYKSVDKLKSFILLELIGLIYQKEIKQQVQALFKGE